MKKFYSLLAVISILILFQSCENRNQNKLKKSYFAKADTTLSIIYNFYGVNSSPLLKETYPVDSDLNVTYLGSAASQASENRCAYLWPYSGLFSAVNVLQETTKKGKYKSLLTDTVLVGLEEYYDDTRLPFGYASYIDSISDRFYDDNIWLGIDFTDAYLSQGNPLYLQKAELLWNFVWSGYDTKLGGGIYWHEQGKNGKNTCSNAPAAVFALKLYLSTKKDSYLQLGTQLYQWTQQTLQDPSDKLYFDNKNLDGKVDTTKYSYNSGQMIQAASLLYKITKEEKYLLQAKEVAESSFLYFFDPFITEIDDFMMVKNNNVWFTAVLLRGFLELYSITQDDGYIIHFEKGLDYAWDHARDSDGLFSTDWSGKEKNVKKWLLTQAAMVEMYARIANFLKQ